MTLSKLFFNHAMGVYWRVMGAPEMGGSLGSMTEWPKVLQSDKRPPGQKASRTKALPDINPQFEGFCPEGLLLEGFLPHT